MNDEQVQSLYFIPILCSSRYEKLEEFEGILDTNFEGKIELFYPHGHLDMTREIGSYVPIHVYLDKIAKERER